MHMESVKVSLQDMQETLIYINKFIDRTQEVYVIL